MEFPGKLHIVTLHLEPMFFREAISMKQRTKLVGPGWIHRSHRPNLKLYSTTGRDVLLEILELSLPMSLRRLYSQSRKHASLSADQKMRFGTFRGPLLRNWGRSVTEYDSAFYLICVYFVNFSVS